MPMLVLSDASPAQPSPAHFLTLTHHIDGLQTILLVLALSMVCRWFAAVAFAVNDRIGVL
jgi:hypothetical protein